VTYVERITPPRRGQKGSFWLFAPLPRARLTGPLRPQLPTFAFKCRLFGGQVRSTPNLRRSGGGSERAEDDPTATFRQSKHRWLESARIRRSLEAFAMAAAGRKAAVRITLPRLSVLIPSLHCRSNSVPRQSPAVMISNNRRAVGPSRSACRNRRPSRRRGRRPLSPGSASPRCPARSA